MYETIVKRKKVDKMFQIIPKEALMLLYSVGFRFE